jgi:DNA repair protein RecO (recombination protein O)
VSLHSTRALVLRVIPYGDSSVILRLLTEDMGQIGLMARGIRKKGGAGGVALDGFTSGVATYYHKPSRELQTLKEFSATRHRVGLSASFLRFAGASAIAEMVMKSSGEEPNAPLLDLIESGLDELESAAEDGAPEVILGVLWRLVAALGYRPQLGECVVCSRRLGTETARLDFLRGGMVCQSCASSAGPRLGPVARAQLEAFADGHPPVGDVREHRRPHFRLLHDFVLHHVTHGSAVRAMALLADTVERLDA